MALVIFDLDETLIGIDSDHAWGGYIVDNNLVDADDYREINQRFFDEYKQGIMDVEAYMDFSCAVLTKYDRQFLYKHREAFVESCIEPYFLPKAISLIKSHQDAGDTVIVVTATVDFITQPIVDKLGIDTLIAPVAEIVDDKYTGKISGTVSIGQGKVTKLMEWLEANNREFIDTRFYSDSINDLPLLEKVDHAIAVDPDNKLKAVAEQNNWEIISLR